jgi:integrase
MTFQFKLRKGKNGFTIISELRYGKNLRIRIATTCVIPIKSTKYWDRNIELLKFPNDILDSVPINNTLNLIRSKVYADLMSLDTTTINQDQLKEKLRLIIKPDINVEVSNTKNEASKIVLEHYQWYITFYGKHNSPNTGRVLSSGTLKTYKNAARCLKDYLENRSIKKFTFDDVSKAFYYDFIQYGQTLGYSRNYIGSTIQKLKTIIQSAYDEDIHTNGEFRKGYFKKFGEEINHPYLNEQEIQSLYDLEIKSPYLDAIRDIFIIACFTGLRIGDLMRFLKNPKVESFNGRTHIHIIQHKTKKPVFIPLKKGILEILEKRNGAFPPYIHKNLINKEIKPLLNKCGITEIYHIEKTIGGKQVLISKPKCEMISCHSARRSFCTNAYNSGVPLQDIMSFSGHSSEKMILLYIKASAKEKAKRASDHSFFR